MSPKKGPFHNERIVFQALLFSKKMLVFGWSKSRNVATAYSPNPFCFVKLRNHHGPFAFLSALCAAALMVARSLDVLATLRGKCQSAEFGAAGLWLGDRSHVDPFGGEGGELEWGEKVYRQPLKPSIFEENEHHWFKSFFKGWSTNVHSTEIRVKKGLTKGNRWLIYIYIYTVYIYIYIEPLKVDRPWRKIPHIFPFVFQKSLFYRGQRIEERHSRASDASLGIHCSIYHAWQRETPHWYACGICNSAAVGKKGGGSSFLWLGEGLVSLHLGHFRFW